MTDDALRPAEEPTVTDDEPVARRGTGLARLSVHRDEAGFRWRRDPGPDRPAPLRLADPALLVLLPDTTDTGAALRLPTVVRPGLEFRTGGPISLLELSRRGPAAVAAVEAACTAVGRALRMLHGVPAPVGAARRPAGPQRLLRWLGGRTDARAGARLRTVVTERAGPRRLDVLRCWCHDLPQPGPRAVLLHGAPGVAQIVPPTGTSTHARPVDLLTGEDVTAGVPALDVGWMLGELVELHETARRGWTDGRPPAARMATALLAGYGGLPDPAGTGAVCVLRLATHLHDFAVHVGWHPVLSRYVDLLVELLDDTAAAALHLLTTRSEKLS